jgi:hypothetical protein
LASDVDILVPREQLEVVEKALLQAGWETTKPDRYDQRYYRKWMHELPPLQHRERRSLLDVHHTVLPLTGRLHPDPMEIRSAARRLGDGDLWVLSPEDMLLHSATHLFHDDDLSGGLRDLFDLDDLLRHFAATDPAFWERLPLRAAEQGLGRPLFYALRYCRQLLGTPIPDGVARSWRPSRAVQVFMDGLVVRALTGGSHVRPSVGTRLAHWVMYARAHWLRMPLRLLLPHLFRKSWRGIAANRGLLWHGVARLSLLREFAPIQGLHTPMGSGNKYLVPPVFRRRGGKGDMSDGNRSRGEEMVRGKATRRRVLKTGALLVPAILTLRATPAWAQTDYTVTAYRYGVNAGLCRNPDFNPRAGGGPRSVEFIPCPPQSSPPPS